jgi:ATPases involved in chromosome partitioning
MGKVVTIVNEKGGVGKSTTAINLAAGLALRAQYYTPQRKQSVLVIDLDPSTASTLSCLHQKRLETPKVEESVVGLFKRVIKKPVPAEVRNDLLRSLRRAEFYENLWFSPTNRDALRRFYETELGAMPNREYRLARSIEILAAVFDYVIIDTPPTGAAATDNGILCADGIIIPVIGDNLALRGLIESLHRIDALRAAYDKRIPVLGIVATDISDEFASRTILAQLRDAYPNGIIQVIHHSADIPAAHMQGKDIFTYRPSRKGDPWETSPSRISTEFKGLVNKVTELLSAPEIIDITTQQAA